MNNCNHSYIECIKDPNFQTRCLQCGRFVTSLHYTDAPNIVVREIYESGYTTESYYTSKTDIFGESINIAK